MELPLLLKQLVKNVKAQKPKPVLWIQDVPSVKDIHDMKKEAAHDIKFDRLNIRSDFWRDLEKREAELLCYSCQYGKVVVLQRKEFPAEIPFALWGEILRQFKIPFVRIFFFASEKKRNLPVVGEEVGPECVNGGYTFPCTVDGIVIYRAEEATRVLIHELLHASCTDNREDSEEMREARTETFAELLLVSFLSRGSVRLAKKLWGIQAQWIRDQNYVLAKKYGITNWKKYCFRYTLAREIVLLEHGIELPEVPLTEPTSCRFTSEELDAMTY